MTRFILCEDKSVGLLGERGYRPSSPDRNTTYAFPKAVIQDNHFGDILQTSFQL